MLKNGELSVPEQRWVKELRSVLRRCPRELELVVTAAEVVEIRAAGSLRAHLDRNTGFGFSDSPLEEVKAPRLYPYSEGS